MLPDEPAETRTVVAPWRRDLTVDTSTWEPGFYVFTLRTPTGWQAQVPYVVTSESAEGTVAFQEKRAPDFNRFRK